MSLLDIQELCLCISVYVCVRRCASGSAQMQPTIPEGGRWLRELSPWVWEKSLHYIHIHVWVCMPRPQPSVNPLPFTGLSHCYTSALIAANGEATWTKWMCRTSLNHFNLTLSLVFTHCSATKPLLFSSWALIELRLNCGSCHCCLLLWKVTCCSFPLTSFRDERRSPENCVCVCYRLCPFTCVCVETKLGVCVCYEAELSSKGVTVVWCFATPTHRQGK